MIATKTSAMIVETEKGLVIAAETEIEIGSDEIAAERKFAERPTETRMVLPRVIMEVLMAAPRVGAEAEVEMTTADTHGATETVLTGPAAGMEIITEGVVACAHALGAQTEIPTVPEIAVIAMR